MHSKQCLAHRVIGAIQDLVNDPDETDFDFRIAMQDNYALTLADESTICICDGAV